MWARAVLLTSVMLWGCGSTAENGPKTEPMPEKPEPEWECTVGQKYDCRHSSAQCAAAKYECLSSAPNSFGPCICEQAALQAVGPTEPVSEIIAGAFGPGTFYWAEYHFVSGAPFSKIAAGPIAGAGQVIIDYLPGGQGISLRVIDDTIYAGSPAQAFTLAGMPLETPDPMVEFPATTPRVGNSSLGFMMDGVRVDDEALHWAEVDDGVYYFTDYGSSFVMFRSFATPGESKLVASAPYPMGGRIGSFRRVWASGTHVYLSTRLGDDETYVLNYLDMSIVGK